jgi:leucine efflux protein
MSFGVEALIVQICSLCYLTSLILGGNFLANQFRWRRRVSSALSTGGAAVFIGFGIRLATATMS